MTLKLISVTRDQAHECHKANHEEWGIPLTVEQYLRREVVLSKCRFAKDNVTYYVLIDDQDPGKFLCHCEAYKRPARVYKSQSEYVEVQCGSIASVFTPKQQRGRGYASKMISLIAQDLRYRGFQFSTLFSDIGCEFYAKLGWTPFSSLQLRLDVKEFVQFNQSLDAEAVQLNGDSVSVKVVTDELLDALEAFELSDQCLGEDLNREYNMQSQSDAKAEQQVLVVLPSADTWRWFRTRSDYYVEHLYTDISKQYPLGHFVLGNGKSDVNAPISSTMISSYMLYLFDFRWRTMYVMRCRFSSEGDTALLWKQLLLVAREYSAQIDNVVFWNPPDILIDAVYYSKDDGVKLTDVLRTKYGPMDKSDVLQDSIKLSPNGVYLEYRDKDSIPSCNQLNSQHDVQGNQQQQNMKWIQNFKDGWV
ncbi:hypothetical protein MIR68_011261 [Amoeboaphelidium protococcarum]|nr:hypothetical protein MIR68_011261 [Amoeboaphelidium protococcarum]